MKNRQLPRGGGAATIVGAATDASRGRHATTTVTSIRGSGHFVDPALLLLRPAAHHDEHDIVMRSPGGSTVLRKKHPPGVVPTGSPSTSGQLATPPPVVASLPPSRLSSSRELPHGAAAGGARVVLLCSDDEDADDSTAARHSQYQRGHTGIGSWRRSPHEQRRSSPSGEPQSSQRRSSNDPSPDSGPPSALVQTLTTPYPSFSNLLGSGSSSSPRLATSSISSAGSASVTTAANTTSRSIPSPSSSLRGWDRLCALAREDGFLSPGALKLVSCDTLMSMIAFYNITEPNEVAVIEAEWASFQSQYDVMPSLAVDVQHQQPRSPYSATAPTATATTTTTTTTSLASGHEAAPHVEEHEVRSLPNKTDASGHQGSTAMRSASTRSVSFDRSAASPNPFSASPDNVFAHYHGFQLRSHSPTVVVTAPAGAIAIVPRERISAFSAAIPSATSAAASASAAAKRSASLAKSSGGTSPAAAVHLTSPPHMQSPLSIALTPAGELSQAPQQGHLSLRASPVTLPPTLMEFSPSLAAPKSGGIARALFVSAPHALRSYSQQSSATTAYFSIAAGGGGAQSAHVMHQPGWSSASAASSFKAQGFDTTLSPALQHKVKLNGRRTLLSADKRICPSDPNVPLHPEPFCHPTGLRSCNVESGTRYHNALSSPNSATRQVSDRRQSLAPKDNLFGAGHA